MHDSQCEIIAIVSINSFINGCMWYSRVEDMEDMMTNRWVKFGFIKAFTQLNMSLVLYHIRLLIFDYGLCHLLMHVSTFWRFWLGRLSYVRSHIIKTIFPSSRTFWSLVVHGVLIWVEIRRLSWSCHDFHHLPMLGYGYIGNSRWYGRSISFPSHPQIALGRIDVQILHRYWSALPSIRFQSNH